MKKLETNHDKVVKFLKQKDIHINELEEKSKDLKAEL